MEVTAQDIQLLRTGSEEEAVAKLNQLLTQSTHQATEQALRALPGVVQSLITQATSLKDARDRFYRENKDFVGHESLVAEMMQKLEAENPGITLEKLQQKLAPEVRKKLGTLQSIVQQDPQGRPSKEEIDHLAGMFEE